MKSHLLSIAMPLCMSLSACSMLPDTVMEEEIAAPADIKTVAMVKDKMNIDYFAKEMVHDILTNIHHVKPTSGVVTTSFIFIDGDYQSSPVFARQLQENFSYELHKVGMPVIDLKSTSFVRITPDGDLGLSKDFTELESSHVVDYILVGTLAQTRKGVQVNAKLVGAKTHTIVAAAQQFIPQYYIDQFDLDVEPEEVINIIPAQPKTKKVKLIKGNS